MKRTLILLIASVGTSVAAAGGPIAFNRGGQPRQAASPQSAEPAPAMPDLATLVRTGWVQIVRFQEPAGARVDIASGSGVVSLTLPAQIAVATGQDYRLRLSELPGNYAGLTFYPTMRLIGYIMPPAGVNPLQYPVPVHVFPRDFEDASAGRLVRNVVYLEDPLTAVPLSFPPSELPVIDLAPGDDALKVASGMGRPILVLQFGNRMPIDGSFEDVTGCPPVFFAPELPPPVPGETIQTAHNARRSTLHAPLPSCSSASTPVCDSSPPMIRLPYKVHPRMPGDEYLCDGGDRVPLGHFSSPGNWAGVSSTETIAQFSRPGEKPRRVASNVVCVYAPRFGLLRTSSASLGSLQIEGPRGTATRTQRGAVENRIAIDRRAQTDQVRNLRHRERQSTLAMNDVVTAIDELRVIAPVHNYDFLEQTGSRIGPNDLGQTADPRIAGAIQAAITWNRRQYPAYTAIVEGGGQVTGYARTGEVDQIREPYRKPGELVLTKVATPAAAKQGDEIEFAIFYENAGERPVESVSIIDSLTTRLAYVADTAQTDRRAVFTAAPNDAQSHELRWDILEPIPGGKGGVVWFRAKVR